MEAVSKVFLKHSVNSSLFGFLNFYFKYCFAFLLSLLFFFNLVPFSRLCHCRP
jgi:hypothetical protein